MLTDLYRCKVTGSLEIWEQSLDVWIYGHTGNGNQPEEVMRNSKEYFCFCENNCVLSFYMMELGFDFPIEMNSKSDSLSVFLPWLS